MDADKNKIRDYYDYYIIHRLCNDKARLCLQYKVQIQLFLAEKERER